jgi:thiamine biosynthesis lipoprotein
MTTTHVFETMGTVVSITHRLAAQRPESLAQVEAGFADWDARFSLYRPDSELSRIASGELSLLGASDKVRETYAQANEWRAATGGAFTAHRPDGVIDLSGVVKALAIAGAATQFELAGATDWGINVGGDVLVAPMTEAGELWKIGIVDPFNRGDLLTSVALLGGRRACATSGSAERGDHIWTTANSDGEFVQATVLADDIVTADVLATAIIAGGSTTLDLLCSSWPIDVITVDRSGGLRMTPGAVRAMHASASVVST